MFTVYFVAPDRMRRSGYRLVSKELLSEREVNGYARTPREAWLQEAQRLAFANRMIEKEIAERMELIERNARYMDVCQGAAAADGAGGVAREKLSG